jgi:plasmid stabilization system protein ParE
MTQGPMTITLKLTANVERNLADIEGFLTEAEAPQAFDALLDDLLNTVIPNLERFPGLGRAFFNRTIRSAEAANAIAALQSKLALTLGSSTASLREYVMTHYLVLYVQVDDSIFLLSIKHNRQLSFDFEAHWGAGT